MSVHNPTFMSKEKEYLQTTTKSLGISIIVDGISLKGLFANVFGHFSKGRLLLVGFQKFDSSIGLFNVGQPGTSCTVDAKQKKVEREVQNRQEIMSDQYISTNTSRHGQYMTGLKLQTFLFLRTEHTKDPSLGNTLEVISFFKAPLVAQIITCRVGIVQDNKWISWLCMSTNQLLPSFFSARIDTNHSFIVASIFSCLRRHDGTGSANISQTFDLFKGHRFRGQTCHTLVAQQSAFDGTGNFFGPIHIGKCHQFS